MNVCEKTLPELSHMLANNETTSVEITKSFLDQITKKDREINAYLSVSTDAALRMAAESDARRAAGKSLGKLDGIPISLKDVVCTVEDTTGAASKYLKGFQSPYDATLWTRLKNAGMVLLGKVNTDEFTMGASSENSAYGVTKNPHDLSRVAGGSSGGSSASIAAYMAPASIGTDTGGSIRVPSHFCGVTGLKVSYGRISRWGTIPMASALDTPGPIAKTPEGCAMLLEALAGKDPMDATTTEHDVPQYTSTLNDDITGLKVGIPKEYFEVDGTDAEVLQAVEDVKQQLENMGAEIIPVSLPHTKYAVATYYIIAPSEISANMSRYDGVRFGDGQDGKDLQEIYMKSRALIGDEVKRRILIGTYALSAGYYDAYYRKAQKVRTLIKRDMDEAFEKVDVMLAPVSPTPAFPIGQNTDDPLKMYLEDIFACPINLAGNCAISVPMGQSKDGLPIGVQLIGAAFAEEKILNVAHQLYKNK